MKFIELAYADNIIVFVGIEDIQFIELIKSGSRVVFLNGDRAYFNEPPKQLFTKKVYTFNE